MNLRRPGRTGLEVAASGYGGQDGAITRETTFPEGDREQLHPDRWIR